MYALNLNELPGEREVGVFEETRISGHGLICHYVLYIGDQEIPLTYEEVKGLSGKLIEYAIDTKEMEELEDAIRQDATSDYYSPEEVTDDFVSKDDIRAFIDNELQDAWEDLKNEDFESAAFWLKKKVCFLSAY